MKKSFFITLLFSPILLIADDLIVDKNSINQYEQDNYAHFNSFNFHGEYQGNNANNPPLPNSISDRINLPETIPILGNQFTIEAMVYSKAHPLLPHRTQYSLPKPGLVQISIYTLMGQKIATLVNRNMDAGQYIITWHAMDDQGRKVPSGIYFYTLESGSYRAIKKLVLLK